MFLLEEAKENIVEEKFPLLPLNPSFIGKDIVDELFGEEAPHNDFSMI